VWRKHDQTNVDDGGTGDRQIASASLATTGVSAASTVDNSAKTSSPIKHVVVSFQENVSFDHYFGTTQGDQHGRRTVQGEAGNAGALTASPRSCCGQSERREPAAPRAGRRR